MGGAGQADEAGEFAQVVVHQGYVGGFDGGAAAGRTHGKADVGAGQGGRIVDAIADHAHGSVGADLAFNELQLVFGQQVAVGLQDADLRGNRLGRVGVITGEHHGLDAQCLQFLDGLAAALFDGIGHGEQGDHLLFVGQQHYRFALGFQCGQAGLQGVGAQALFVDQAVVAQQVALAVDLALGAAAGQGFKRGDLQQSHAVALRCIGHGAGYGVVRAAGQAGGNAARPGFCAAVEHGEVGLHRFAVGQGAGFVQRQPAQLAALLQKHAAFDKDALSRRRRQAADDGDRGGDHQRAGAGNHQQHQRFVDPGEPVAAQQQRRQHGYQHGERQNHGGIDLGELVHETLGGGAGALGGFYGVDGAGQRAVIRQRGHHVFKRTGGVDRARKDAVAHRFFHRQALTGNGGLVDGGAAAGNAAVQRQAFARLDTHAGLQRDGFGFDGEPAAVSLLHGGMLGGELQQTLDGVAGAVQRQGLDALGQGEQHHHHGCFGPLA